MIFSCARLNWVKPMRFAGTCSRYSKSAMPQEASAAMNQGLEESSFRCAYQAKVMNTFESVSNTTVCARTLVFIGHPILRVFRPRAPFAPLQGASLGSFPDHTRSRHALDIPQLAGGAEPVHPDAPWKLERTRAGFASSTKPILILKEIRRTRSNDSFSRGWTAS